MGTCYQATELSNIEHELVYGQVCLVFIGSVSFEGDLTPQKHTSSMITTKKESRVHQRENLVSTPPS